MTLASPPGVPNQHNAHRRIREMLAAFGIAEPAAVTRANDIADALDAAVATDPTDALAQRIGTGKIKPPAIAEAALDAATTLAAHDRLGEVRSRLAPVLDRMGRGALVGDAARIAEDLRTPFAEVTGAVAEAVAAFGADAPPKDALRAPAMAALWDRATAARQQLRALVALRVALAESGYGTPHHETPAWWVTTADDLDRAPHGLERIIAAGIPVRLNTAEEITRITSARDTEAARIAAQRDERKRQERENDPMVRALDRAKQRAATHAAAHRGGPRDAA